MKKESNGLDRIVKVVTLIATVMAIIGYFLDWFDDFSWLGLGEDPGKRIRAR